jgi:chorismate mutase
MAESESRLQRAVRAPGELVRLREAIDRVDEVLVRLLNQRAKYAIEIGEIKGVLQLPIYSPDREKQVLENIERWSDGPLSDSAVRRLFERIIDESRRVEREASGTP